MPPRGVPRIRPPHGEVAAPLTAQDARHVALRAIDHDVGDVHVAVRVGVRAAGRHAVAQAPARSRRRGGHQLFNVHPQLSV